MMELERFANQVIESCASTNDLARALGEAGYPHGTWVSAHVQEKGRGRLGREWKSAAGNLHLSVVLRAPEPRFWSWVPLAGAVGAARALQEVLPSLRVRIKWPNDLWIEGAKLGGILCEGGSGREAGFIVLGIGVNCADSPKNLDQPAVSLTEALGEEVSPDSIRPSVVREILREISSLAERGPALLRARFLELAALGPGAAIEWGEGKSGHVEGLGESGELLVRLPSGLPAALLAEDVKIRAQRS